MPRLNRGIAFPDPIKYHQATYLYTVIAWCRDYNCKQQVFFSPGFAQHSWLILMFQTLTMANDSSKPLFHDFLLTPVLGNPEYPPGVSDRPFQQIMQSSIYPDFFCDLGPISAICFQQLFDIPLPRSWRGVYHSVRQGFMASAMYCTHSNINCLRTLCPHSCLNGKWIWRSHYPQIKVRICFTLHNTLL